jgi:DNA-binding MarR family transcriptional regulator
MMRLARNLRQTDTDELSPSLASALFILDRHGPLTLGELAKREHVTKPSVTAIVDKLVRLGLIERTADHQDRRVTHVSLTAAGRRRVSVRRTRRTAWLAARMNELTDDDVRRLSDAADVFERLILMAGEEPPP